MKLIMATFSINEYIEANILRATVGSITLTREVSELPIKHSWLKEEAEKELKSKHCGYNNYRIGNLQSISDITDLLQL